MAGARPELERGTVVRERWFRARAGSVAAPAGAGAAVLFPELSASAPTPFVSKPVTNLNLASHNGSNTTAKRTIAATLAVLPARRRWPPDSRDPGDELRERRLRDGTKSDMADAVWAVLSGLESVPLELSAAERMWLGGLLRRDCRAHAGTLDVECPGSPECHANLENPFTRCAHVCPSTPACPGSLGRLIACTQARVYRDLGCGASLAEPISCHIPACPDCEPQRQAKHAAHYEAVVRTFDWRDVVLAVFTARNPRAGELRADLRRNTRDLAKLRRTAVFTGRGMCLARAPRGGPMHECRHRDCSRLWKCERRSCDGSRVGRSCRARLQDRCVHPECRPNCRRYRHRGVRAGVWSIECPPSEKTPGTWNLHANGILVLRDRGRGDRLYKPFLAEWSEVSWYWARATCRHHRRCPGRPRCQGGAWNVHLEAYDPSRGIREYLKYVTKPSAVLDHAGAGGMVEFILARRRVKFLSAFGGFFGRRFVVDPADQARVDAETVVVWVSPFRTKRFPKICPACRCSGEWDGNAELVPRVSLELIGGLLGMRASPEDVTAAGDRRAVIARLSRKLGRSDEYDQWLDQGWRGQD